MIQLPLPGHTNTIFAGRQAKSKKAKKAKKGKVCSFDASPKAWQCYGVRQKLSDAAASAWSKQSSEGVRQQLSDARASAWSKQSSEKTPVEDVPLCFNDSPLDNPMTLDDVGIRDGDTVYIYAMLIPHPCQGLGWSKGTTYCITY